MNAFTKVSEKGQVVVPKALRDAKGWIPGTDLEAIDAGDGVLLRARHTVKRLTTDEAVAIFKQLYQHNGPPVSLAEMKASARRVASGEDKLRG